MSSTRLDHAQSVATAILDAIHGGDSLEALIKEFPKAEKAFKSMASPEEPFFYSMAFTYDSQDNPYYILVSSAQDKDEFLIDTLTAVSVMDTPSVILIIDAYIKIGEREPDTLDMSLEQMYVLEKEGVYPCLSIMSYNTDDGLSGRYVPYSIKDAGVDVLLDKIIEVGEENLRSMDEHFQTAFGGMDKLLNIDVDERISEFWIEFISNADASQIFFEDTTHDREGALKAFETLKTLEDGKKYAQCVIEDALLDASCLHILSRPSSVIDTYKTIAHHIDEQTELGQWLTKARLTS